MAELDIDFVRRQFPPLADGWGFFENAGGAYVPGAVIDRVAAYMTECQVQPGRIGASATAAARIAEGHRRIAAFVNADPEEVVIGPSTTSNLYVLARAIQPWLGAGNEIVVTDLDHEANNTPWRRLAAATGARLVEWRLRPETGGLHVEDLDPLLSARTRLVCFSACSNITGTINDVAAIARRAHAAGALVCVDAVAYAAHRLIDVRALDVDFLAFSLYKLFGPHLGLLYGKRDLLRAAEGQNHDFFAEDDLPVKLVPGGVNHELTAALAGIVDYFEALHDRHFGPGDNDLRARLARCYELVEGYEMATARPLLDFLAGRDGVRLLGRRAIDGGRAPTFAFDVPGADLDALQDALAAERINVGVSDFYAPRALRAYGLDPARGVMRASLVHYNSAAEVDRLIAGLDRALG